MKYKIFNIKGLFSRKREEPFYFIKNQFGFSPGNLELYKLALTHKSSSVLDVEGQQVNNERLEFLGDAVLDLIVAHTLYERYPHKNEGFLTNARAKIVNRSNLNKIAKLLHLKDIIQSTNSSPRSNILGNAFEALVGAIYLDKGYQFCLQLIQKEILNSKIDLDSTTTQENNFKSKLLEHCQKHKKVLEFKLISEEINDKNIPLFITQVVIDDEDFALGKGRSKKESHQLAAKKTIGYLKNQGTFN